MALLGITIFAIVLFVILLGNCFEIKENKKDEEFKVYRYIKTKLENFFISFIVSTVIISVVFMVLYNLSGYKTAIKDSLYTNSEIASLLSFSVAISLIIIIPIVSKLKFKLELKRLKKQAENYKIEDIAYYRDILNNISPAILGYLYKPQTNYQDLIIATIIHLEQEKIIEITNDEIKILNVPADLNSHEREVMAYLNKYSSYDNLLNRFEDSLIDDMKQKNYVKDTKVRIYSFNDCIAMLILWLFLYTIIGFAFLNSYNLSYLVSINAILFFVVILSEITFTIGIRPIIRTKKGMKLYSKINGLANFLKDFTIIKDRNIEEINLYDDYIMYGIIFDLKGKLDNESARKIKNIENILTKTDYHLKNVIPRKKYYIDQNNSSQLLGSFIVLILGLPISIMIGLLGKNVEFVYLTNSRIAFIILGILVQLIFSSIFIKDLLNNSNIENKILEFYIRGKKVTGIIVKQKKHKYGWKAVVQFQEMGELITYTTPTITNEIVELSDNKVDVYIYNGEYYVDNFKTKNQKADY